MNILTLVILTISLVFSQTAPYYKSYDIQINNTESNKEKKQQTKEESQICEEDKSDSLRCDIALKDALNTARAAFKSERFAKQYELQPDDSSFVVKIEIIIGKLFKSNQKYLLLRRHVPWSTYIDLYKINGDKAEKLVEREQNGITYIRDTIFDVNGDGYKDFLVHSYPSSGCCIRNVYNVYLNQPSKGSFSQDYEFINPTFFAKEKTVRGVEYGHPGEVGLYKYKWNGLRIDTVEFIYPDINHRGKFIRTKKRAYRPSEKDGVSLKSVPEEYRKIESYEWFTNF